MRLSVAGPKARPAIILRPLLDGGSVHLFSEVGGDGESWYAAGMTEIAANARMIIRCPAWAVFDAFADPDVMTNFWFPRASGRLEEGKDVTWYVGSDADAYEITVRVIEARRPHKLHIRWGDGDTFTDVVWQFECRGDNETVVRIRESGFTGNQSEITRAALDSTAGFNQVITAAKALLEHDARINVVRDHVA